MIKQATAILLDIENAQWVLDELLEAGNPMEFCLLMQDLLQFGRTREIPDMPRERRAHFRMLQGTVAAGTKSMDENAVLKRYAGYVSAFRRQHKADGTDPNALAVWWAEQPDYSEDLFRGKEWYGEALFLHQQTATPDNGCQRVLTGEKKENGNITQREQNQTETNGNVTGRGAGGTISLPDERKKYGTYHRVDLSESEFDDLCKRFGRKEADRRIGWLDYELYRDPNAYKGNDHYSLLENATRKG